MGIIAPAERWELLARRAAVESARLRLAIAEAQAQEATNRILAAHGITGACDIAEDGTITTVTGDGCS